MTMEEIRYLTNEELEQTLHAWTAQYPRLAHLHEMGRSYEDRSIWLLTLTNQETGAALDKPALWIDANIHATEITGTSTAMRVAQRLLEGYAQDAQITRLLDTCTFYIAPRINPDGAALAMADHPQYIRSGSRPYPYEDLDDGLHAKDMDGDGRILQMRIPDPNGDWKISHLDPRLMEKRSLDETGGSYYRLLPEGQIENYDGWLVRLARPHQGLDFNRNFPFEWRTEGEQSGAGPYPASEPEIKAMLDFITSHPNINLGITFHTYSRVILRPYSTKADDDMHTDDLWVFKKIGERGTQLTGYRCVSTFHDFKYHPKEVTTGAFDDWMYDHLGIFCYTIELWDLPTEAGIKDRKFIEWWREHPHEEDLQILQWADEHAPAGSYVNWYPYQHPQLGAVELGGWNSMYTWRNPPPEWLGAEVERHVPFMLSLAELLPHLSVVHAEAKAMGEDSYHVEVVVENSGFLPSYTSRQGQQRKAIRPVRVALELPEGASLVSGKAQTELGHLEGRSNKLGVSAHMAASPTDNRQRLEWVLRAPKGSVLGVQVLSERAGALTLNIALE